MRSGLLRAGLLGLVSLAPLGGAPLATEEGAQNYPLGVNTVVPGIAPPPGHTWWQNYFAYYSAGNFADSEGNPLIPGFELDVAAYAPRLFHGWPVQWGSFGLASALVLPIVYARVESAIETFENFDISDATIQPLYLTYVNGAKTFFAYGGVDFYIPTGTSISRRYLSANPGVAITWFPAKGVDLNLLTTLEFALTNNERTDYRSGNLLIIDYSGHVAPFAALPEFTAGFNGYYLDQFTSDEVGGVDIDFEGRVFAIGPELIYQIGQEGGVAFKWQHELDVRNRPQGDKIWFQVQVPLRGG